MPTSPATARAGSYLGTQNCSGKSHGASSVWVVPGLEKYHGQDIFLTEALTREMNGEIEKTVAVGVPFFAYMSHYAVHVLWSVDKRFAAHYPGLTGQELAFATTIEGMDKSLGDIMAKLNELGVAQNTLVIFYSDNGSDLRDGKEFSVLRGFKGTSWEGGMRVPLIAATPGEHCPQQFLQPFPHGHNSDHFTVFREDDWKLIYRYRKTCPERLLFNLATDIGETNDLAASEPEKVKAMTRKMADELHRYGAQFSVLSATGEPLTILPGDIPDGAGH